MKAETPARLQKYLAEYGQRYPEAWKDYQKFRVGRGGDLPNWPDWCWCPLAAAYAIISGGGPNKILFEMGSEIGIVGALSAWRMTKGIYRFDTDLFSALWSTQIEGDLPIDILYYLPEWCVYIEAPDGYKWFDSVLLGWYTYLEWDVNENRPELRFVLDCEDRLWPYSIHLDKSNLIDCVAASMETSKINARKEYQFEIPEIDDHAEKIAEIIEPLVSVSLYLCSQAADISDLRGHREHPGNPRHTKTKEGMRTFSASNNTVWLTGYRIGHP